MSKYFKPHEFEVLGCSIDDMDSNLLNKLDQIRAIYDKPMVLTSAYREGDNKAHGKGLAVDVRVNNAIDRFELTQAIMAVGGIYGVGIYDKHIHIDTWQTEKRSNRTVLWIGISK